MPTDLGSPDPADIARDSLAATRISPFITMTDHEDFIYHDLERGLNRIYRQAKKAAEREAEGDTKAYFAESRRVTS